MKTVYCLQLPSLSKETELLNSRSDIGEENSSPDLEIAPELKPLILRSLTHAYNASFYTIASLGLLALFFLFSSLYNSSWVLEQALSSSITFILSIVGGFIGLLVWLSNQSRRQRKEIDKTLYPEMSKDNLDTVDPDKVFNKLQKYKAFYDTKPTSRLIRVRNLSFMIFLFEAALVVILLTEQFSLTANIIVYLTISGLALLTTLITHAIIPRIYNKDLLATSLDPKTN